jgi:hypothetical protein
MATATKSKVEQLAELFIRASLAAEQADPGEGLENDGGTCNLDSPAFRVDRCREATIRQAADLAGVSVCAFTWFGGRRWYWLNVPLRGQANRRSKMACAAGKVLRDAADAGEIKGLEACMYMQSD